jgi:hypothetical protein
MVGKMLLGDMVATFFIFTVLILSLIVSIFGLVFFGRKILSLSINYSNYEKKKNNFNQVANKKIVYIFIINTAFNFIAFIVTLFNDYLRGFTVTSIFVILLSVFILFVAYKTEVNIVPLVEFDKFYDLILSLLSNEEKLLKENTDQYEYLLEFEKNAEELILDFQAYINKFDIKDKIFSLFDRITYNKDFLIEERNNLIQSFNENLKHYIKNNDINAVKLNNPFGNFNHDQIFKQIEDLKRNYVQEITNDIHQTLQDIDNDNKKIFNILSLSLKHKIILPKETNVLILNEISLYKNEYQIKTIDILISMKSFEVKDIVDFLISNDKPLLINSNLINGLNNQDHFKVLINISQQKKIQILDTWLGYLNTNHVSLIKSLISKLKEKSITLKSLEIFLSLNNYSSGFHQNFNIVEHKIFALYDCYQNDSLVNKVIKEIMYRNDFQREEKEINNLYDQTLMNMEIELSMLKEIISFVLSQETILNKYIDRNKLISQFHMCKNTLDKSHAISLRKLLMVILKYENLAENLDFLNMFIEKYELKQSVNDIEKISLKQFTQKLFNGKVSMDDSVNTVTSRVEKNRLLFDTLFN